MSRIGKNPVPIPDGVTVTVKGGVVEATGPKGTETLEYNPAMNVELKDKEVVVSRPNDERTNRALHGLTRTLIANAVQGVHSGYEKVLEINGVGYKAELKGKILQLSLGYASPIDYEFPPVVQIAVDGNKVKVQLL